MPGAHSHSTVLQLRGSHSGEALLRKPRLASPPADQPRLPAPDTRSLWQQHQFW